MMGPPTRGTVLLLNGAHALDHMFLLIFATAVVPIAAEFGFAGWEDLMPYSVGAFVLFGLGALPSGRLGDLWGRRRMMLIFFFGMGASALVVALTRTGWQLACALTLLGAFSSIYHPVGIPMLVRGARRPGLTIGISGLSGNLGVALAAVTTGLLVKYAGWRAAFALPGMVAIVGGLVFARVAPEETLPPARGARVGPVHDPRTVAGVLLVMTVAAISSALLFNFTTNGNGLLLRERFAGVIDDPALLGALLAGVYVIASFAQVAVGLMIDRYPLKYLYIGIVAMQVPFFVAAAGATGWALFALQTAFMVAVFGAIPFTDAIMVRYVDDRMRSRVSGIRLTVSFGVSSAAVYLLGPAVKLAGFGALLTAMGGIACVTLATIALLPRPSPHAGVASARTGAASPGVSAAPSRSPPAAR